jgi:phosphoribosylamine--glycine ligase
MRRPRTLVVGAGAREHALAAALHRSEAPLVVAGPWTNPGLRELATAYLTTPAEEADRIVAFAKEQRTELAVLGPEAAIAAGVADALRAAGIATVGPGREAGRIESSKAYARGLMAKFGIPGLPAFQKVTDPAEVARAAETLPGPFVVKPSGLSGGKGVWVQGADFASAEEGIAYAKSLLSERGKGSAVVLEEKLEGEEFSLLAFVDGTSVYPMPAVQDYKRALEGNQGGNTGGMGSYSSRDQLLPFLSRTEYDEATEILRKVVEALRKEGQEYRGIIFGGFMLTADGLKVLEFNSRFGDPEALNVLTLYEGTDFADLLFQVARGRIDPAHVEFRPRATVVKYLVPQGYGATPKPGATLTLDRKAIADLAVSIYYGNVTAGKAPHEIVLGSSRGVALVGESSAIKDAEARVSQAIAHVKGDFYVRRDIATAADLKAHVDHLRALRNAPPPDPTKNPTRSGPAPPQVFS